MTRILAVDIDNTLVEFTSPFLDAVRQLHGIRLHAYPGAYGDLFAHLTEEQVGSALDLCREWETEPKFAPYHGAAESLHRLSEAGLTVEYHTARRVEQNASTAAWLDSHGFPAVDDLYHSPDKTKDFEYMGRNLWGVVDDRPQVLTHASYNLGIHAVGIEHSYNMSLHDCPGIELASSWAQIEELLLERL